MPEPEFGTRTIARHPVRAGTEYEISRGTVQRAVREPKPAKPRPHRPKPVAADNDPHRLLTPTQPNEVWHMDLSTLHILWMCFTVRAILDGFSRRLLDLRMYTRTPRTDHGAQFRKRFGAAMTKAGIHHVQGKVRQPFLNGKIERLFKSFRGWWRFVLPTLTASGLQRKLDSFKEWYNTHRVHAALGGRTSNEAAGQTEAPTPIPIHQRDHRIADIQITRRPCRGDPRLPIIDIALLLRRAA